MTHPSSARTRTPTLLACWLALALLGPFRLGAADGDAGNLVANPGFEEEAGGQALNWDGGKGTDWDGAPLGLAKPQAVAWQSAVVNSGRCALHLTAPATVISDPIPVGEGVYRVSGWLRTRGVVRGSKLWHDARIQLVQYDAAGRQVGHTDVGEALGDSEWTRYQRDLIVPAAVASLRFYLRLFPGTRGEAWFDDLACSPVLLATPEPIDRAQATVSVDLARGLGPFPYRLEGVASHYLQAFAEIPWKRRIADLAARRLGVRSIRFQEAGGSMVDVKRAADGTLSFDFARLGACLDGAVAVGLTPLLVLESTPAALAVAKRTEWTNRHPPADLAAWEDYMAALLGYLRQRYGDQALATWEFETWNEPEASRYFHGSEADLAAIHDADLRAAARVLPGLRIGTPGFASASAGLERFLQGIPPRPVPAFVSWHSYATGHSIPTRMSVRLSGERGLAMLRARPWGAGVPAYITEWNSASGSSACHLGTAYNAAWALDAMRQLIDLGIARLYFFQDCENPRYSPPTAAGYYAGHGLISPHGLIRPVTRAFELLHRMQGERLEGGSSNRPIGVVASRNADGSWITCWNHSEDPAESFTTRVRLALSGLPPASRLHAAVRVIGAASDPFPRWQQAGSPDLAADDQAWRRLDAESGLDAGVQQVELATDGAGNATLDWDLPSASVLSLHLGRHAKPGAP